MSDLKILLFENLHLIYLFVSFAFLVYWIISKLFKLTDKSNLIFKNAKSATKNPKGYVDKTMISNFYKDWWCYLIEPIENNIIKNNISPNLLTISSLFFSLITAVIYGLGFVFVGSIFLLSASTFDILDGRIARKTNSQSSVGSFLDSTLDRICEIFIMFGIFYYYFPSKFCLVVFIALVFSLTVSYIKAAADNLSLNSNVGLMQRADRVVYLGVGGLISSILDYFNILILNETEGVFKLTILFIAFFSLTTTIQRILHAIKK